MNDYIVEVTVDSLDSAINAKNAGASRIEICADLSLGGTTASYGLLNAIIKNCDMPMLPIIRARAGDFLYSEYEYEAMLYDVEMMKDLGFKEIITGFLTLDGELDIARTTKVIELFDTGDVCLHRAFDMTRDLQKSFEIATKLGIKRILTSGGKDKAIDGIDVLSSLNKQGGADILAGSGVNISNVDEFKKAGIRQVHFSARGAVPSEMKYIKEGVAMGVGTKGHEYDKYVAKSSLIKELVEKFTK